MKRLRRGKSATYLYQDIKQLTLEGEPAFFAPEFSGQLPMKRDIEKESLVEADNGGEHS